jgi:hypothetical protein
VIKSLFILAFFAVLCSSTFCFAGDQETDTSQQAPSAATGQVPQDSQEAQNNRMRALEGSKSKWSAQIQAAYSGSTIDHPFSADAPNPGGLNPPPVVSASALIQGRYRINKDQSFGLGGGVTGETPFQGVKNVTLSDPTADWALSSQFGSLHNRFDVVGQIYTANYEIKYGYARGVSLVDDLLYNFASGLTVGLTSEVDYNAFSTDKADGVDVRAIQKDYNLGIFPVVEYKLSKRLNLRSVMGFQFEHDRNLDGWTLIAKRIYQTAGIGVSATDDLFFYLYALFYPSPIAGLSHNETSVGFSAIINLF